MSEIYLRIFQYAGKILFHSNLFFYHSLIFSLLRKYISLALFHSGFQGVLVKGEYW